MSFSREDCPQCFCSSSNPYAMPLAPSTCYSPCMRSTQHMFMMSLGGPLRQCCLCYAGRSPLHIPSHQLRRAAEQPHSKTAAETGAPCACMQT